MFVYGSNRVVLVAPQRTTEYVAYEAGQVLAANPVSGESVLTRPEVWVQEYPSIKVLSCAEKTGTTAGGKQWRNVSIEFDAASAGSQHSKFNGNTSDPAVIAAVQYAHEHDVAVYLVMETRRKPKNADRRDIPLNAGIVGLRADGRGKPDPSRTRSNCVKVVAAVGQVGAGEVLVSSETLSVPGEWAMLRTNRRGDIPPPGWRHVSMDAAGEGDEAISMIVPSTATSSRSPASAVAGPVDVESISAAVTADVLAALRAAGVIGDAAGAQRDPRGEPQRRAVASEGKPWECVNSDNRVNMGSNAAKRMRGSHASAFRMLVEAATDRDSGEISAQFSDFDFEEQAWVLADQLLRAVDYVQGAVCGYQDRKVASAYEAWRWLAGVIEFRVPFSDDAARDVDARGARREWLNGASRLAVQRMRRANGVLAEYIGVRPSRTVARESGGGVSSMPDPVGELGAPAADAEVGEESASVLDFPPNESRTVMAADDPAAMAAWESLLEHHGKAAKPHVFNALLAETFGNFALAQIPADTFSQAVAMWRADDEQFRQAAIAAYSRNAS